MKNRNEVLAEMQAKLEQDIVTQSVILEYKTFQFEQDPKMKGNTEAEKELKAVKFTIDRSEAMLKWVIEELAK